MRRSADPCSCQDARLHPSDLPTLTSRGTYPAWDTYLEAVYGSNVTYPVFLHSFAWFYRCDCRVINLQCNRTCPTATQHDGSWRSSCLPLRNSAHQPAVAPFQSMSSSFLPKVWMADQNKPPCQVPFREAFVGVHLAAHARRNPMFRSWPNPEFRLAPFGLWLYPRVLPKCLPNATWVEVIRVRETFEASSRSTWYYHAPGSGVWLNTGRSDCIAAVQRDRRQYQYGDQTGVAEKSALAARGFRFSNESLELLQRKLAINVADRGVDTMQRNGPFGNMLEIVDVRDTAAQRCGKQGCTCTGTLRTGWSADRPCHCRAASELLQCV